MSNSIFRRLPARYGAVVMPFILSVMMTFVVSGISTVKALGLNGELLRIWPVSWALSWLVAFPTLILILPLVRRLVALLVAPPA
ncbi:DUF2798 domain-containing protein [Bosea sp. AS-1]|uniref:DUF2798 domain-containing protein n=1 Tax=Bosea sp. AS-1 TaxID=2015316 RepID=UPI000B784A67|nr:DUF2798 domain-containing protein [Bosea sp. AS-1]